MRKEVFVDRGSILVLLLAFLSALVLQAQSNLGAIAGTVVDQTGATIAGAKITAKNIGTGATTTATTGSDGGFRISSLQIGDYDLTASREGFTSVTHSGVPVQVNNVTSVSLSLNVGSASTSVTVQASGATIQAESSDIGSVITTKQVIQLPLALGGVGALRSPESFVFLAPGTSGPGTGNSNNGIFISKIGGGQNFGNEILLDGASILRSENGSSFDEAAPSVEAIAEFKVLSATFPAEYGRTSGGIESYAIKSGTNQFHGTAYDIFRNEDLDANTWFNNGYAARCAPGDAACRAPYARPADKKNDYGGNLGGPVIIPKIYNGRNKTFFFFNWEQYRQNNGQTNTATVPTAAERNGDFSALLNTSNVIGTNPCDGSPVYAGQIFDPTTTHIGAGGIACRSAFPGNQIPASRISPISQKFLTYLPLPNTVGANGINYVLSSNTSLYNTTYTIRIDENFSEKDRLFATYDSRENTRYAGNNPIYPGPVDPNGWNQDFITHYGRVGWDHIFSPALLNHMNLGYNRTNSQNYTIGAVQATKGNINWASQLGLSNILGSGTQFPLVTFGENIPNFSSGHNDDNIDNGERFNDYVTWVKGNHTLTFGFDFRNQLYSNINNDINTGNYIFSRNETTAIQSLNGPGGNSFAAFLLGTVNSSNLTLQGHVPRWVSQYYAGFIQDDWKVKPNLTLNLGLRYDVDVPREESYNNTSNFDPTIPNPGAANYPGALTFGTVCSPRCNTRWADTWYKDIGPRIGFAWTPGSLDNRIVIRGGWGIYYAPLQYSDFGGGQQQGYTVTPSFISADKFTPAFNWNNGFPAYTPPPNLNPAQLNGQAGVNYTQPSFGRPGLVQSWSLQVQGQVSKNTVATLGYVGQRATHLHSAIQNINNIPIQDFALGSQLTQNVGAPGVSVNAPYPGFTGQVQQALRPFPQYQYIVTDNLQNVGQSSYESLQASLEHRYSYGLTLQSSFTWAKILTDADSILPGINGGISQIQNPQNLRDEKALSSQDVPYTFTAAPLYELPFGKGKPFLSHGIGGAVLGGWQIGAVLRYQSGVPISFGCGSSIPGWDNCIRFSRTGQPILNANVVNGGFDPFTQRYFNRGAFVDPNANRGNGPYQLGNFPRNNGDARAPHYYNEDFSVLRNFTLHESFVLQAKAEFLNAFNRHIFSIPNPNPNDPNFGLVNSTIDLPRSVQFTLRLNF